MESPVAQRSLLAERKKRLSFITPARGKAEEAASDRLLATLKPDASHGHTLTYNNAKELTKHKVVTHFKSNKRNSTLLIVSKVFDRQLKFSFIHVRYKLI